MKFLYIYISEHLTNENNSFIFRKPTTEDTALLDGPSSTTPTTYNETETVDPTIRYSKLAAWDGVVPSESFLVVSMDSSRVRKTSDRGYAGKVRDKRTSSHIRKENKANHCWASFCNFIKASSFVKILR